MSASFHVLRTLTCSLQLFAANNTLPHSLRHSFARSLPLSQTTTPPTSDDLQIFYDFDSQPESPSLRSFVRSRENSCHFVVWIACNKHTDALLACTRFRDFQCCCCRCVCVCVCLQFSRPGLTTSAFTLPATSLASVCLFSVYIRYCTFGLDLQQPPLCTHMCALFYVQRALVLYVTYTNNFQRWIELGCV